MYEPPKGSVTNIQGVKFNFKNTLNFRNKPFFDYSKREFCCSLGVTIDVLTHPVRL